MATIADQNTKEWPPGTVRIETLQLAADKDIILQPRPSDDPNDPLNWAHWRKRINFGLAAWYAFLNFGYISAVTPTWIPMNEQLGFSYAILNDAYALGGAGTALAAFVLVPFALKYGRRPIYIASTVLQFAIAVWSAKQEKVADQMLVNLFLNSIGALAEVMVQMTVADMFFVHQRGVANTIYVWVAFSGAFLWPVAGGFMTITQGWRWVWWWYAIFFGMSLCVFIFAYEETKYDHSTLGGSSPGSLQDPIATDGPPADESPERKNRMVEAIAPERLGSVAESQRDAISDLTSIQINPLIPRKTYRQRLMLASTSPGSLSRFARHVYQPIMILFTIPAVFYMSLIYGLMLTWFAVMTSVLSIYMAFPPYNFNPSEIGLMSLSPFVGATIGSLICGPLSDRIILFLARRNGGIYEPEMRLWVAIPFLPLIPAGSLMFGFGLMNGAPWPVLAAGYALNQIGGVPISSIALTYITDSYTKIVADAMVSVTFVRNIIPPILLFALTPWIARVGINGVFITLNVIGIAVLACVFLFVYCGKQFRALSATRYQYFAERQFDARSI